MNFWKDKQSFILRIVIIMIKAVTMMNMMMRKAVMRMKALLIEPLFYSKELMIIK